MTRTYDIINVYSAYETVNEFGALGTRIGYFLNYADAKEAAKGRGWYGNEGIVATFKAIQLSETGQAFLLQSLEPLKITDKIENWNDIRKRALDKLSQEEKKVLGIS